MSDANELGRRILESAAPSSDVAREVTEQLERLHESYGNLQATATQIKDRLRENLAKWRAYSEVVGSGERFLVNDLAMWWAERTADAGGADGCAVDSLEDAQFQIENTRAVQQRLQQIRQELASAGHKCEARPQVGEESAWRAKRRQKKGNY